MPHKQFIEIYYRENYDKRVKFARKRIGNYNLALAEEAVQEAFFKALKYFPAYNKEEGFENWFGTILINCINDVKNAERDRGVSYNEDLDGEEFNDDFEITKEVVDLFAKEPGRNRAILNMYFFYDFKSREIAEVMQLSHDVVRDVIRAFRRRIRRG